MGGAVAELRTKEKQDAGIEEGPRERERPWDEEKSDRKDVCVCEREKTVMREHVCQCLPEWI